LPFFLAEPDEELDPDDLEPEDLEEEEELLDELL
jgi:hypothetical protein